MDDILIGTNRNHLGDSVQDPIRQHFQNIRKVLLRFLRFDHIASLKKVQFFVKEVDLCGHLLSGGKRHPAKGKLVAVQQWEKPNTITGLRAFSGYVRDYAGIVSPMMELLKLGGLGGK